MNDCEKCKQELAEDTSLCANCEPQEEEAIENPETETSVPEEADASAETPTSEEPETSTKASAPVETEVSVHAETRKKLAIPPPAAVDDMLIFRVAATIFAASFFFLVIMRFEEINILDERGHVLGLLLTVLFLAAGLIAATLCPPPRDQSEPVTDSFIRLAFALVMIAGLMAIRGSLLYYVSGDYANHLAHWIRAMEPLSVREALSVNVGNYNMPYMYILLLISRIDFPGMFLIKFASMVFDVVLAYFVMKLVSLRTENVNFRLAAFLGALAIPTVIINGSMWAQCDVIYSSLAIGALYFAMAGKSKHAYIFMGLAFSFKMQAVFVLPMFLIFLLKGKIRLQDIWLFPVTFSVTLLPATIAGMPIGEAFSAYFNQFEYYSWLNMNATSIWRLVGWIDHDQFITAGLFVAGTATVALLYFIYLHRDRITKTADYVYMAYLFAAMLPFLLPKMHDRFLFMADVLSLVVFAYNKKRWYVPLVTIYASYNTYVWFLMGQVTLIDYVYVSIALGVVILIVLKDLVERLYLQKEVY